MSKYEFLKSDCETILADIKHQEKQLKLKRRWLMGLSTDESKSKQSKNTDFLSTGSFLPESVLREDGLFFETIKERVNKSFRAGEDEKRHHLVGLDMPLSDVASTRRLIFSHLDALTNKGLYLLALVLSRGSVNFERTRKKMKRFIKASLPKVSETDVLKQLSQLLNDPQNFRGNSRSFFTPSHSLQDAAAKVVAGLEDLHIQTLVAMHGKLRGGQASLPGFPSKKRRWNKDSLIKKVRKTSEDMLSELNEGDKLQEPLAKALAIATLSMKLSPGYQNSSAEFRHFSPEVQALQNEIVKAIKSLKTGIRFKKLKTLLPILDPHSKVSKKSFRAAIKTMLTEYLFESVDIDEIPKSLLETVAVVNKNSRNKPSKCFTEEEAEQEVECILNVSAQTKQIALDLLTDCEFDNDFADAYMEDLEESDDDDNDDGQQKGIRNSPSDYILHSTDLSYSGESIGESKPDVSTSSTNRNGSSFLTPQKRLHSSKTEKREAEYFNDDSVDPYSNVSSTLLEESMGKFGMFKTDENPMTPPQRSYQNSIKRCKIEYDAELDTPSLPSVLCSNLPCSEEKMTSADQCAYTNHYLALQEMCDETSIAAYNLIGHMMEVFAQREGLDLDWNYIFYLKGHYSIEEDCQEENKTSSHEDVGSVIAQTVEKLVPSLPKSAAEKLKEFMGL